MGLFDIFAGTDINAKVAEAKADPRGLLLDVRTRPEYQMGHIEGAVCVPLGEMAKAARLYGDKHLYVYCASGSRSRQAVAQLRSAGAAYAENIGGIAAWRGDVVRG